MAKLSLLLPVRCRRGQILIPSFFVIPSLFLFVFIVFETAKLSREKIRHQFAVDSAAFIEMTNYSDFLNRSAYVNGAFPERIFAESFYGTCIPSKHAITGSGADIYKGCGSEGNLFFMLWENNAFPSRGSEIEGVPSKDDADRITGSALWPMHYANDNPNDLNVDKPSFPECKLNDKPFSKCAYILTSQNALDWWIQWEDAMDVYKLYFQIYQLLGSVFEAQLAVFNRLTKSGTPFPHTFYRKSVWLNTGETGPDYDDFSRNAVDMSFRQLDDNFHPKAACVEHILFFGNQYTPTAYQPYKIYSPDEPATVNPLGAPPCEGSNKGLFQVAYTEEKIKDYFNPKKESGKHLTVASRRGKEVKQLWRAPENYWGVKWDTDQPNAWCESSDGNPCVHATVSLTAADPKSSGEVGGRLWPNPTPKFQTRLFP